MAGSLARADQQAMLIVGTFVMAQQDPAIWERFTERMFHEWERDADDILDTAIRAVDKAVAATGRPEAVGGAQPGVDAPATDNHTALPQNDAVGAGATG